MPTVQIEHGVRARLIVLILLSVLVGSCFIGVPLALFAHGFTHQPLIAAAVAAGAVGLFFAAVVRALRATTRMSSAPTRPPVGLTAVVAEEAVPVKRTAAPPASAIVHLLFSGPPTMDRRPGPARMPRSTTNADLLNEILVPRPERERDLGKPRVPARSLPAPDHD